MNTATRSIPSLNILHHSQVRTDSLHLIPSWEADSLSVSQGTPHFLMNPNVHSRLHNRPHSFDVDISSRLQPRVFVGV